MCISSTLNVSSVVGAPRRCGVLTTLGGIAGREHDSIPQSEVGAPRLPKRSLPRLDCCCCCFRREFKESPCPHDAADELCTEPSMANNCWPSRAPKTPLRAGTRRPTGRSAKMANTAREHPPLPCESSSHVHAESTAGSEFTFTLNFFSYMFYCWR